MCIYDGYNFLIVEYVGHDWAIITRKHGSNFLPSKTSDCRILGSGGYILGGGVWWGYTLDSGGWWWVYFGRDGWWWGVFVGW